jgi:hypothetical protein
MIGRRSLVKSLLSVPLLGILPGHTLAKDDCMSSVQSKSQTVLVTPGQAVANQPLDNFIARSVTVDNPTGQWFYLPNQQRWIAPYTLGTIVALNSGQEGASSVQSGASLVNIQSQTPAGQISRPVAGQSATFVYSTDVHPNAAGTALITGVITTSIVNNTVLVLPHVPTVIVSITCPSGFLLYVDWLYLSMPFNTTASVSYVKWQVVRGTVTADILAVFNNDASSTTNTGSPQAVLQPGDTLQAFSLISESVAPNCEATALVRTQVI